MIIFGTRGITYKAEDGAFHCPACNKRQHYQQKRVRRFFTLYFIPLIPLDTMGEFVECGECEGTYDVAVLDYDPDAQAARFQSRWEQAVLTVIIRMMLADGRVDDQEVKTILNLYDRITHRSLSEADVLEKISAVEAQTQSIRKDLEEFLPALNEHGKEMVVRAALAVASADGEFQAEEQKLLGEVAEALNMSQAHVHGILNSMVRESAD